MNYGFIALRNFFVKESQIGRWLLYRHLSSNISEG